MTLEAIAEADGTVSHMTVKRALDDSTLTNVKVPTNVETDPTPSNDEVPETKKAIGKDGKDSGYPATRRRRLRRGKEFQSNP